MPGSINLTKYQASTVLEVSSTFWTSSQRISVFDVAKSGKESWERPRRPAAGQSTLPYARSNTLDSKLPEKQATKTNNNENTRFEYIMGHTRSAILATRKVSIEILKTFRYNHFFVCSLQAKTLTKNIFLYISYCLNFFYHYFF